VSDSKTASRSSKCRKTTPPDRAASPKIPHSSAKDAQNCFLNCLLPKEVARTIDFHIDEI